MGSPPAGAVAQADAEQPVHLAADHVLPGGLAGLGDIQHEVVLTLDGAEPLGRGQQGFPPSTVTE
jgi:hypothetical protein